MSKVRFNYADKQLTLSNKKALKLFTESIFTAENKPLSHMHYIFCSDEYLLNINRNCLNHDYYTDIITFGLSEPKQPIEAEVYISLDRVKENANSLGVTFRDELSRVLFHGALHLCGYKDKTKSEVLKMRAREDHYLQLFKGL